MAEANDPAPVPEPSPPPSTEAVQEQPAAAAAPAEGNFDLSSLPMVSTEQAKAAKRPSMSPERLQTEVTRFDRVLVLLTLVFAFCLASFTARNSDLWLHLATGRALVQGQYAFGSDPFSLAGSGIYWVNHSWLYDLIVYGSAQLLGGIDTEAAGAALVVVKALLVTSLAGVLLVIRQRGTSAWTSVFCAVIALLAMSPALLLQPLVGSLVFLGLTLWVLTREGKSERTAETRGWRVLFTSAPARLCLLPVLFLVWANLDSWFFLGPLVAGLYLLGDVADRLLRGGRAEANGDVRALAIACVAGTAACLVNPHLYRVFVLPPESLPSVFLGQFKDVPSFQGLFVSPFSGAYFSNGVGGNAAGVAYFVLLALGLFSFMLQLGEARGWRVVVWIVLAVWSGLNSALVPFFAVAAGPITALNLQDFGVRRFGAQLPESKGGQRWALCGRFGTVVALAALLFLAWPGWLQVDSAEPLRARRVAWGIRVDPSCRKVAEQLAAWRQQGLLAADAGGFNFDTDVASYCAWFCPAEKCFFDNRFTQAPEAAADYLAVRRAVLPSQGDKEPIDRTAWRRVFRQRHINHVILNEVPDRTMLAMLHSDQEWTLLYLDGRSAIFGWRDSPTDAFARLRFDLTGRAFGADAERAPAEGPGRGPQLPGWWQRYLHAPAPRPLDADETNALIDLYYRPLADQGRLLLTNKLRAWRDSTLVSFLGMAAGGDLTAPIMLGQRLVLGDYLATLYIQLNSVGPPAAPVVALRAARRAIAANPDDPRGYAGLARSAEMLWRYQENTWAGQALPPPINPETLRQLRKDLSQRRQPFLSPWVRRSIGIRQLVRQVAVVWGWQQALAAGQWRAAGSNALLRRDRRIATEVLAMTYWEMGYYDLSLHYSRALVKMLQTEVAEGQQDQKQAEERLHNLERVVQLLESALQDLQTDFQLASANVPPLGRAILALRYGQAQEAIKIIEEGNVSQLSPAEGDLLIYLYLTTGQFERLNPGKRWGVLKENLKGLDAYNAYQALLAAAAGDYALAGESMDRLLAAPPVDGSRPLLELLQGLTSGSLLPLPLPLPLLIVSDAKWVEHYRKVEGDIGRTLQAAANQREWRVLRGIVALEEGDVATAREQFQQALKPVGPMVFFESRAIAQRYLELLEGKVGSPQRQQGR